MSHFAPVSSTVCQDNLVKIEPERWSLPRLLDMNARSCIRKIDEIAVILKEHNIDCACTTGSWVDKDIPDSALKIDKVLLFPPDQVEQKSKQRGRCCLLRLQ